MAEKLVKVHSICKSYILSLSKSVLQNLEKRYMYFVKVKREEISLYLLSDILFDFIKLAPKPKIYTGIVKYRGPLEQKYNSRIYVGVRLDEPGKANTRGIYPDITIVKSSMFYLPFLLKLMQELQKLVKVYENKFSWFIFFIMKIPRTCLMVKHF